ncbi:MAG: aminotransferase class III-fold pyridoxal phosphate-dependent enzyme, partial [Bacteroidetes bacterium]|nr:aminotransferase class III-fold pyridoxal phosphate-dependent enzyme [Bacteroidota bacterium]
SENKGEIAAIIVEPVAGNMGCILPETNFLSSLRNICDREGMLLIFDEVMTGFRLAAGGAQEKFNIKADIITYGKVIGAGLPVGAFAGKAEIMNHISPVGNVYQAGTLSGNPLAMIAGYTLLSELKSNPGIYKELEDKTVYLRDGLKKVLENSGCNFRVNQLGSMISIHFSDHDIVDFETASKADIAKFNRMFHFMLENGIYLPPSAYESWFLNNALEQKDLDKTIDVLKRFLEED